MRRSAWPDLALDTVELVLDALMLQADSERASCGRSRGMDLLQSNIKACDSFHWILQAAIVQPYGDEQRASKKLKSDKKSAQATLDTDAEEAGLTLLEVFRRLRALDQPVTLFGEVCRCSYAYFVLPISPRSLVCLCIRCDSACAWLYHDAVFLFRAPRPRSGHCVWSSVSQNKYGRGSILQLQEDAARRLRLRVAAASLATEDDQRGGQQGNELLALMRASKKAPGNTEATKNTRAEKPTTADADGERVRLKVCCTKGRAFFSISALPVSFLALAVT